MEELTTYTVIDVETPNHRNDSVCSIGIMRVKDNIVIYENEFLINPEAEFDSMNIGIHHITEDMIKDMPNFKTIWEKISKYFTNGIIVGHNVKFDMNVICKILDRYEISIPTIKYIDTYPLFKRLYSGLESYRLNKLCESFDIVLDNHHNALCDVKACYGLLNVAKNEHNISENEIGIYKYSRKYNNTF